jgi:HD superfamily phosphohydrolase YqeK
MNDHMKTLKALEYVLDMKTLKALEYVLDMTDESVWGLIHSTVSRYVSEGKMSIDDEQAYKAMVIKKLNGRAG